jgi:hypothetical protein
MKSLQHVLWRGALALSLLAAGIGSGLGMPPVEPASPANACPTDTRLLAAADPAANASRRASTVLIVLRHAPTPAG